jgi:hypothetical protein
MSQPGLAKLATTTIERAGLIGFSFVSKNCADASNPPFQGSDPQSGPAIAGLVRIVEIVEIAPSHGRLHKYQGKTILAANR